MLELGGVTANDFEPAFDSHAVARLFEAQQDFMCRMAPEIIFLCVDPNGGGPSEMVSLIVFFIRTHTSLSDLKRKKKSIVSGYYVGTMAVVSFFSLSLSLSLNEQDGFVHDTLDVIINDIGDMVVTGDALC